MVNVKVAAIVLLSAVCFASGMLDPDDDIRQTQPVYMMLKMYAESLRREIRNFTETGYRSDMFNRYVEHASLNLDAPDSELYPPTTAILTCTACRLYVASLLSDRRNGAPAEELADSAFGMCRLVTDFSEEVCRGVINLNLDPMMYIVDARPTLTATQMCGLVLQGECGNLDPMFDFSVNVSPGQPITQSKSFHIPRSPNDMKIIQVTDLHYDENYVVGNNVNCGDPICCRTRNGPGAPGAQGGFWGDYRHCGTPWRTIENTLRHIRSLHPDAEMIYHTGDMRDHGVWETTVERTRQLTGRLYALFREVFGNTPVFHALGNHEGQPVNQFAPWVISQPAITARWLYDFSADTWLQHNWITPAAAATVRQGGYYTMLVRPGFRIIAINNNDCYNFNFWILYSRNDIQAQLQWLHNTLLAAEANHERVHIIKHIRSGSGSPFRFWQRQYRRIIDRFHLIIGAQFDGHSHRVEYELFYDVATAQHAVNVAWNAGSVSPYNNVNPNFNVYYVDRTHYQVTDYESHVFSLSEANLTPAQSPRWFRHFQFVPDFQPSDMSIAGLDRLAFDISRNRNLGRRYWENRVKASDPHMAGGCNDDCLRGQVCGMVRNEREDDRRCNQVLAVFGTVA